ncbi:MAG: cupin domain-containing protein [Candidatus Zixiibacteriota bacterium]|nr:MAG: cupin domain-containing protein [candidate division Zixibacteria bacterium]
MAVANLTETQGREMAPGVVGKFVHSDNMTLAYVDLDEGATMPEHSHPQEQIVNVIKGTLELTVEGTPHQLVRGTPFVLAGNIPHGARAVTACKVIDAFYPCREDFK